MKKNLLLAWPVIFLIISAFHLAAGGEFTRYFFLGDTVATTVVLLLIWVKFKNPTIHRMRHR